MLFVQTLALLEQAEAAVNLSLQYFDDVLAPKSDGDDDGGKHSA